MWQGSSVAGLLCGRALVCHGSNGEGCSVAASNVSGLQCGRALVW